MKPRVILLFGWLAAALAATAARAEVEFAGYMRTPLGEVRFVLADPAARQTSELIGVGGSFAGYRVTGFDAKSETLAMEKDGVARQLRLKSAALADAGAAGVDPVERVFPFVPETIAVNREIQRLRSSVLSRTAALANFQLEADYLRKQQQERARNPVSPRSPDEGLALAKGQEAIDFLDREIAKTRQWIELDRLELDRNVRTTLVYLLGSQLRNGNAEDAARTQTLLRELDARLAKAGAERSSVP